MAVEVNLLNAYEVLLEFSEKYFLLSFYGTLVNKKICLSFAKSVYQSFKIFGSDNLFN